MKLLTALLDWPPPYQLDLGCPLVVHRDRNGGAVRQRYTVGNDAPTNAS
jgi:hypothetical protein